MRILLTIKSFNYGGAENHVCELANMLSQHNHQVYIIARKGKQVKRLDPKIEFIHLAFFDIALPINLLIFLYYLIINRIEIIHAHQRLPILMSCLAGTICRVPVIATVHGRPRFDLRSDFVRKKVAGLIFVSDHVLKVSSRYNELKGKAVIIPNGIKIDYDRKVKDPYKIVYLSRTDRKHAEMVQLLLKKVVPELVKDFPMLTLLVIGTTHYPAEILGIAEDLNKKNGRMVCSILGDQEDLYSYLSTASVVIGVGRVAIESLSLGTPVLIANYNHLGELASRQNYERLKSSNFVDVHSPKPNSDQFILTLRNFFNKQDYWQDDTNILKEKVIKDFEIGRIAKQIEMLYYETINKRNFSNN